MLLNKNVLFMISDALSDLVQLLDRVGAGWWSSDTSIATNQMGCSDPIGYEHTHTRTERHTLKPLI